MKKPLKPVSGQSLADVNPELAKQWHQTKNGALTPYDVRVSSNTKVWWKCSEGDDHEWDARIAHRQRGSGCQICSSNKVVVSNSLATLNPNLANEWHPTKNAALTPYDVTTSSGKKIWWKCPKGSDHEWPAIVANRNKGIGCPICSNQRVARSNSLGTVNPELAREWHPTRNNDLTPFDVLPSANRKFWWQCPGKKDHIYEASLNNRHNGKGCPYCANQRIIRSNSLGAVNPSLAKQWHPSRNGELSPYDVAPAGNSRVWWKCPKGDDHEWEATVNHRASGTGCPKCNPVWSIPELRIYSELKTLFPSIQHRAILEGYEVDIFIPEIGVGIEYDGVYWHQDKLEKDKEKNAALGSSILLIRIREEDLPLLSPHDVRVKKRKISISTIKKVLIKILEEKTVSLDNLIQIREYLGYRDWVATQLFNKLYSERKSVSFDDSLCHLMPELSQEWHPSKNDTLLPEHFTPGASRLIWWLGSCGHEWQDTINHRSRGRDCPKCRYKKSSATQRKNRSKYQLRLFE
jgi:hypothetical protein